MAVSRTLQDYRKLRQNVLNAKKPVTKKKKKTTTTKKKKKANNTKKSKTSATQKAVTKKKKTKNTNWHGLETKIDKKVRCAFYCKSKKKGTRLLYAQYNPEALEYEYSANFTGMTSPGMNYPIFQYIGGDTSEFNIELFFYEGRGGNGKSIRYCEKWFTDCMPPRRNKKPKKVKKGKKKVTVQFEPPIIDIRYGYYKIKCVLKSVKVKDEWMNQKGKPIMSRLSLTFIRIGRNSYF